ncbi:hypothetical protein HYH03_006273 [Edaphochlamys debaryana]|uniref:Uncharacterized protein n=1 Tax=Edaphochlamys debaryana TaxID=47281 RepID=A0A836C1J0_9CHLO|nr:hypothetical protein HYH03_006273 [Edaphochlamys debaryana]|eukprot:KAG2495673.1 hypothetical protein HYH03_006273 [Edaphochlamys debaryana]
MLLRRAYSTLSTPELRAEYASKMGMPSARANDPRFARFERWRREVIPDLQIQLGYWARSVDYVVDDWKANLERREATLQRLYNACVQALRQLRSAEARRQREQQAQGPHTSPASAPAARRKEPQAQAQAQAHMQAAQQQPWEPQPPGGAASGGRDPADPSVASAGSAWGSLDEIVDPADADVTGGAASSAAGDVSTSAGSTRAGGSGAQAGTGGTGAAADPVAAAEAAMAVAGIRAELEGIQSDSEEGTARVQREVDKRYEQVSTRYPAYPAIVWMDLWEETSELWLARGQAEAQRCAAAGARWAAVEAQLRRELAQAVGVAEAEEMLAQGPIAGAGTGRFEG